MIHIRNPMRKLFYWWWIKIFISLTEQTCPKRVHKIGQAVWDHLRKSHFNCNSRLGKCVSTPFVTLHSILLQTYCNFHRYLLCWIVTCHYCPSSQIIIIISLHGNIYVCFFILKSYYSTCGKYHNCKPQWNSLKLVLLFI